MFRLHRDVRRAGVSPTVRAELAAHAANFAAAIEYVPYWVVLSVAVALGAGTAIGYKRIVVTVAEKIGKAHMTYAQGAAAELVAALTITLADISHMPVSTTHVLSSGVAGTMWANRSGIQGATVRKIGLAWILTLPAAILLSAALFSLGGFLIPAARPAEEAPTTGLVESATAQDPRVTELTTIPVPRHHSDRIAFSPDGKILALPKPAEGRVELWDIGTGKVRHIPSPFGAAGARAFDAIFSKDGRFLATNFEPGGVALCELARPAEQIQIPVPKPTWLVGMAFLAGAPKLVMVSGVELKSGLRAYSSARWNVSTGKREDFHEFYPGLGFETISPDGRFVLLQNGREQVAFDSGSGTQIFAVVELGRSRFSPDCSTLISYHDEAVTRWAVPSGKKLGQIQFAPRRPSPGHDVKDRLAISSDNKLFALGAFSGQNTVTVVRLDSGKVLGTFECCPPRMFCSGICFSPNGRILATATYEHDNHDQEVEPLLRFWKIPDEW